MSHRNGWGGAVPVFLVGREPDDVAGPDLLDRAAFALRAAEAGGHNQRLSKRVGVPGRSRAWLEGTLEPKRSAGSGAWNNLSIQTEPVNQSAGPCMEACVPTLVISIFYS